MHAFTNANQLVNPANRNQTLFEQVSYAGLPVMHDKGPFVTEYLEALLRTLNKSLDDYPRLCSIRFDLRFPHNFQADDEMTTNTVISRFIESLKAKIEHDRMCARRRNPHAHQTKVRYVWAREVGSDGRVHYHVALFLNGDAYFTLGKFDSESVNLGKRITAAWASALWITESHAVGLVHFSDKGVYRIQASDPLAVADFFHRASYLCKVKTKSFGFGYHGFGYSRT